MLLTSPRLPLPHGFTTREGGVSEGPYCSLNLGRSVGDQPERVEENARRLARAAGLTAGQLVSANQVHGEALIIVEGARPGDGLPHALGDADGLLTRARGAALCIRTADCAPVLLAAPDHGAAGAVHAGWRGALLGIAGRAVERMRAEWGVAPRAVSAAIGPCIRRCCYVVGEDLAAQFVARFGDGVVERRDGEPPRLDIVEASRLALIEAGVPAEHIDPGGWCTHCDERRFFSHRRDRGVTGRHLSFVAL